MQCLKATRSMHYGVPLQGEGGAISGQWARKGSHRQGFLDVFHMQEDSKALGEGLAYFAPAKQVPEDLQSVEAWKPRNNSHRDCR